MGSSERHTEPIPKGNQRLPDLRLEEDNYGDANVEESITQDESQSREILFDREPVEENEGCDTGGHGRGTRTAQELQNCIHKQKDECDIRDVARFNNTS